MPDLGPFPPLERPAVWVLFDGHWLPGQLLAWLPRSTPGEEWRGAARWMAPANLQYETAVPARWLTPRRDAEGHPIAAPPAPEGELGMMPAEGLPTSRPPEAPPFE